MSVVEVLPAWGGWLAAVVAGLAALGWLGRKVVQGSRWLVRLGRKLDKLADLADYELQHNGGSSIKDAATLIPAMKERLEDHLVEAAATRASVERRLEHLETQQTKTIADLAEALPVVAKSIPPEEVGP